jgi:hypothetical protein
VLAPFTEDEETRLPSLISFTAHIIQIYLHRGLEDAATLCNQHDLAWFENLLIDQSRSKWYHLLFEGVEEMKLGHQSLFHPIKLPGFVPMCPYLRRQCLLLVIALGEKSILRRIRDYRLWKQFKFKTFEFNPRTANNPGNTKLIYPGTQLSLE